MPARGFTANPGFTGPAQCNETYGFHEQCERCPVDDGSASRCIAMHSITRRRLPGMAGVVLPRVSPTEQVGACAKGTDLPTGTGAAHRAPHALLNGFLGASALEMEPPESTLGWVGVDRAMDGMDFADTCVMHTHGRDPCSRAIDGSVGRGALLRCANDGPQAPKVELAWIR